MGYSEMKYMGFELPLLGFHLAISVHSHKLKPPNAFNWKEETEKMNQKFGGGKLPTGTPSLAWSSVVVVASLLAGASVVHNIFKPDLTLPPMDDKVDEAVKPDASKS